MLQSAEVQLRFFENRPKKRAIPVRRKYLSKPVSKGVTALNEECHDGVILEADPFGIMRGMNHLFVYADANPVNNIDPEGLHSFPTPPSGNKCVTSCHSSEKNPKIQCKATGSCKNPHFKIKFKPECELIFVEVESNGDVKFALQIKGSAEGQLGPCSFKIECSFTP